MEEKKKCFSTRSSFILGISKRVIENSWLIWHEIRANKYKAIVSGLIYLYFIIINLMSQFVVQFSSIYTIAGQVVMLIYLV